MNWSERSLRSIWHPFTQMMTAAAPMGIVSASGAILRAENGREIIDAVSSWWVNVHGHAHPYIAERVSAQLTTLEHVIFAGFTHPPAVELAERLLGHLPDSHARVFFSDNGSTAVEVALKMAIQFHRNRGDTARRAVVALEGAYHGDTFGAMSASGRGAFTAPFADYLFDVRFVPAPYPGVEDVALRTLRDALAPGDVAACILEPLVQGVAGMRMYSAEALGAMLLACADGGALSIADEVMTGFMRTGRFFACDHLNAGLNGPAVRGAAVATGTALRPRGDSGDLENIAPDIICLSKALTGGTLPMGITSCAARVYDAFHSDDRAHTFFHGHSYTANPIGCAAALASLDLLERSECQAAVVRICAQHEASLVRFRAHARVRNARALGTILAVEIETGADSSYFAHVGDRAYAVAMARGVLLRPLGNVIYTLPPYCITDAQLSQVYDAMEAVLNSA